MTGYGFFGQFEKIEQQIYLPKNLDNNSGKWKNVGKWEGNVGGKLVGGKCHQIDFILSFGSASEGLLSWSSFWGAAIFSISVCNVV